MTAIKSHHSRVFEKLVAERQALLTLSVLQGQKRNLYHRLVGQIQGLDDALKLSEEADYKLNGEDIGDS